MSIGPPRSAGPPEPAWAAASTADPSEPAWAAASTADPSEPAWAAATTAEIDELLAPADRVLADGYPGERAGRQPVHTVYLAADRFQPELAAQWGQAALAALADCAPGPAEFSAAMDLPAGLAAEVLPLVRAKLAAEPVEDLRLDFEDGYGDRGDAAEDADARAAARRLASAVAAGTAPPFTGLRCKGLEPATRRRAIATLDAFLAALLRHGPLPDGFVITLPKVSSADQVRAMGHLCGRLEEARGLAPGRLRFEVQVETPQLVLGADGAAEVARCVHAGGRRLTGLHYGTYDYSATLQIAAGYQSMDHPAADYARAVMQVAAAGTGVRLSDGSTNVLPAGRRDEVVAAWRLHSRLVQRSLRRGFYQGWDLHPGHLVSRYAATFAFFREGLPVAAARLKAYLDNRAHEADAGLAQEPATVRAGAGYLARGLDCGAVSAAELAGLTGLEPAGLYAHSGRPPASCEPAR